MWRTIGQREGPEASPEGHPLRPAGRRAWRGRRGPEERSGAVRWPGKSLRVRVGPFPQSLTRPGPVPPAPYPTDALGVRQQQLPQDLFQAGGLHGSSGAAAAGPGEGEGQHVEALKSASGGKGVAPRPAHHQSDSTPAERRSSGSTTSVGPTAG